MILRRTASPCVGVVLACVSALAQAPNSPPSPAGTVLFERSTPAPDTTSAPEPQSSQPAPSGVSSSDISAKPAPAPGPPDQVPAVPVTDAERTSILISAYDLDLHLVPTTAGIEARAAITLRNITDHSLSRIPLQLSSTLHWQIISTRTEGVAAPAVFTQSPIATDTDHTGYAQEAVVTLPEPLKPGATLTLTAFYTGQIKASASRLELIGTPARTAAQTDWDQVSADEESAPIALRGFGDVLWYPCAEPIALLGDGNRLFDLVGRTRLQDESTSIRLRLTVEYIGDPPAEAFFDGHARALEHQADTSDELVAATHGVATAEFDSAPIGFRVPSLFVTLPRASLSEDQLVSTVTFHPELGIPYTEAARSVQPLVATWFGPTPLTPLTLIDHPGQPFDDGALLLTPLQPNASADALAPMLVHGLTHAWMPSAHPWISEGLAQFTGLLWTEQTRGRDDALLQLQQQANLIALAEPDLTATPPTPSETVGQPLIAASSEIYFRAKAAAVWWQLRDILGDENLKRGLQAYRHSASLASDSRFDRDPRSMQTTLERISQRKLDWFFDDWVYRDRGLPDLTIDSVAIHPLPAREGKAAGFLVAVNVKNDGDAICEVPVIVRSGELSASERLRIPAHSSASTRIPFESTPQTLQVNDGSVPELRSTLHIRTITAIDQ